MAPALKLEDQAARPPAAVSGRRSQMTASISALTRQE